MKQNIVTIEQGVARMPQHRLAEPVDMTIAQGDQIAIVGDNGAGKSLLVDIITGAHPLVNDGIKYNFKGSGKVYENIKYIAFRDSYGDGDGSYYYQQRWNSTEIDDSPIVGDLLPQTTNNALKETLYRLFDIDRLLDKRIILLSSGEMRKFQITKTLLSNPKLLIMDNPFIGLDPQTREQLHSLIKELITETPLQVVVVLAQREEIPSFATHVIEVKDMVCREKCTLHEYITRGRAESKPLSSEKRELILSIPYNPDIALSEEVINFNNVSIRYGSRTILQDLSWSVEGGDRWALSGENGAGKSTLLSLVCADNPQRYACDITLFGGKRGSGISIWDIKKRIGYVSPEMHRAYMLPLDAIEIVASGLHDTIGVYNPLKEEEIAISQRWMEILGIENLQKRTFTQLSSGEQRLVLLARAFVKDPQLLILDEPMHGLDDSNTELVKQVIDTFCQRENKTIVVVSHYADKIPSCIDKHLHLKRITE